MSSFLCIQCTTPFLTRHPTRPCHFAEAGPTLLDQDLQVVVFLLQLVIRPLVIDVDQRRSALTSFVYKNSRYEVLLEQGGQS